MWDTFVHPQAISKLENIIFVANLNKNRIFPDMKRTTPNLDKNKTCFGLNKILDTSCIFKIPVAQNKSGALLCIHRRIANWKISIFVENLKKKNQIRESRQNFTKTKRVSDETNRRC